MKGTRLSRFGSVVIFAFVASISSAGKPAENQDSQEIAANGAAALPQYQVLYERMLEARNTIWTRFHDPVTMKAKYPVDPGAAYCLLGAYWKARLRGYFQP